MPVYTELRPEMRDIAGILIEIQKGGLKSDLPTFTEKILAPIRSARVPAPKDHPRYDNVRFLEDAPSVDDSISVDMNPWTDNTQLSTRSGELADLIAAYPTSDVGPLLSILDEALTPRWMFWKRHPPDAVILGAINALSVGRMMKF